MSWLKSCMVGHRVTLICEGKAFEYSSVDGESTQMVTVLELESSQEKTDTRVGLYSLCAKDKGCRNV